MRRSMTFCCLLTLLGSAAGADVLVTREGAEIETRGAWKIKGRTVVFTMPNGTLSSLRLDEVDLDKSAIATARRLAPPPAPAVPDPEAKTGKKAPVMVITDRDVRKAATAGDSGAGAALRVGEWKISPLEGDPAFELIGSVTNGGETAVSEVEINATLWSPDRTSSLAVLAGIDKPRLGAGETSRFRIPLSRQQVDNSGFAETFGQGQAEFSIKAQAMVEEPPEPGEEEAGEETEVDSESVN